MFCKSFPLYTVWCKYSECVQQYIQLLTLRRGLIWGTVLPSVNYSVYGCKNCLQWKIASVNIFYFWEKFQLCFVSVDSYLPGVQLAEIILCVHAFVHRTQLIRIHNNSSWRSLQLQNTYSSHVFQMWHLIVLSISEIIEVHRKNK